MSSLKGNIHTLLLLSSNSLKISLSGSPSAVVKLRKELPSKRLTPVSVANQINPALSWMAWYTLFPANPSLLP